MRIADTPAVKEVDQVAAIFASLPKTDKQKKESLAKIEDAYFKLGDLYYFQLGEKDNAAVSYKNLLKRFPGSCGLPIARDLFDLRQLSSSPICPQIR